MYHDYDGCSSSECVRRKTGPKKTENYLIDENCAHGQNGNADCPYKRHVKIERQKNGST